MLLGILLAAVIVVCVALVGVILLQRSEGGVLGMSGGGAGNFMSARGTGDLLTRTTQILAAIFFLLCLLMTIVTGHVRRESSLAAKLKNLSIAPPTAGQPLAPATNEAPPQAPVGAPLVAPTPAAPPPQVNGLNLFGNQATTAPPRAPVAPPLAPAAKPAPAKPAAAKPDAAASSAKPAEPVKPAKAAKPKPAAAAPAATPAETPAPSAAPAPAPTPAPAPAAPASPPPGL